MMFAIAVANQQKTVAVIFEKQTIAVMGSVLSALSRDGANSKCVFWTLYNKFGHHADKF